MFFHVFLGFGKSFQDAGRIGQVLYIQITAELSGGNAIIRQSCLLHKRLLNTVIGTHIFDLKTCFFQIRNQSKIRRHMTGGAAACQKNFFHKVECLSAFLFPILYLVTVLF